MGVIDSIRVGGPTNPLLANSGLSTATAPPMSSSRRPLADGRTVALMLIAASSSLSRLSPLCPIGYGFARLFRIGKMTNVSFTFKNCACNPHDYKIHIWTIFKRLGLVSTIKDRANEIYKRVEDQKSSRVRNQDALLAAYLYIALRQEEKPRTVKEICSVANGASKKEIGRAKEYIVKQLGLEKGQSVEMGTIHAGYFMRRFCSHLGMNNRAVKAAQEAVQKLEEFDIRRSPISIAAEVIYIITQLSDDKKALKGVAEGTIRNSYKDHYPHVSKIISNWYAKEDDLKNLCSP